VFEGKIYTYEGGADLNGNSSNEIGFFALGSNGKEHFFSTSPLPPASYSVTLNPGQTYTTCFMAGTLIATPRGQVPVEQLAIGDTVLTSDGREAPVRWIGVQTVSRTFANPNRVLPIRIKAGAIADHLPARDLLVSPCHALFIDGVLVQAGALVNGSSIVRETDVPETFVYYHIELDDHTLILAEGVPAETFIDHVDRMVFDNWAEHEALYPRDRVIAELPYARAAAVRQVPASILRALALRAESIVPAARTAA
jgi:hypothetical protein